MIDFFAVLGDSAAWHAMFASMPWLWPLLAAFLGAVLASFGGVVVDRVPRANGWIPGPDGTCTPDRSVNLVSPSRCICGVQLGFVELVPVIGWLARGGRCRSCHGRVPKIYPAVELGSAAVSALIALHFGPTEQGVWALCALWTCVVAAWIDFNVLIIPDSITLPLALAGLLASPFDPEPLSRIEGLAYSIAVTWAVFKGAEFMIGVAVAEGDVALIGAAGAWLGLQGSEVMVAVAPILFMVFWAICRKADVRYRLTDIGDRADDALPMGPAICVAFIALLVWNAQVQDMILRLMMLLPNG